MASIKTSMPLSCAMHIQVFSASFTISSSHLLFGLAMTSVYSLGVHSAVILAHLLHLIFATCPAHFLFKFFFCLDYISDGLISFLIFFFRLILRMLRSMLLWAASNILDAQVTGIFARYGLTMNIQHQHVSLWLWSLEIRIQFYFATYHQSIINVFR